MLEKFNSKINIFHENTEKKEALKISKEFQSSREAAKSIFNKVSSWEELNAAILEEAEKKFNEKIKETWREFVVSGVFQFDDKGKQVFKPFTDLDGRSALGILKAAGIDTSNLTYVRPGESLKGAINLDTGDKFGVIYEDSSYTLYFDHHAKNTKEVTSTAEIVYKTMVELGKLEKSEAMDRLVDFVTKIDNRQFPPEEFLKSAKTILGLQRDLSFENIWAYFKDHESPTEELTQKELEKYGLKNSAGKQQRTIDEAMETLERMEKEGKVIDTKYGKIVVNENNELKVGAPAAYVKFDGIINFTPGKSFAVTLKEKNFNEENLRNKLGDNFQGKVICGKMWLYNETEPLKLSLQEIIRAITVQQDEVFNPEIELNKILKQPKNKRKESLKLFKEKLIQQKLNLASLEVELFKKAEKNSNITITEMEELIEQKSNFLTEEQKSFLKRGALEYFKKRGAIRDFLKDCFLGNEQINGEKVYEKIFGVTCSDRPKIIIGNLSVTLFLNERDFKNALKQSAKSVGRKIELIELIDIVKSSAAIQLPISVGSLEDFVIIAKAKYISRKNDIIQHEQQHIYHAFITSIYDAEWREVLSKLKQKGIINTNDLESAEELYNLVKERDKNLTSEISEIEDIAVKESHIKDEILGYFKIGMPLKIYFNTL